MSTQRLFLKFGLTLLGGIALLALGAGHAEAAIGDISTIAGTGTIGYNADNIDATTAHLNYPSHISADGAGNVYIADNLNHRVRRVDVVTGLITTIAGTGTAGFNADNIDATTAQLNFPLGVFVDGADNVYIADWKNHRVRRVDAVTGLITTVAGTGTLGYNGDNIDATTAQLYQPSSVFLDGAGNMFITDEENQRVRRVDAVTGLISAVAGTGTAGYNGDNIDATTAQVIYPRDNVTS